jgi:UDP-N-acetylglucosamine 2-epimerase
MKREKIKALIEKETLLSEMEERYRSGLDREHFCIIVSKHREEDFYNEIKEICENRMNILEQEIEDA